MHRLALCALLALAAPARAHDYWLVPDTFTPKPKAPVNVRLFVGEELKAEQELPFTAKKTRISELATARDREPLAEAKVGTKPAFSLALPGAGTAVLRVDRDWSHITLKADKFTAYLKEEGLSHIVEAREKAGAANADASERYRRCLKALLHGGTPDGAATRQLGQVFEIVPTKDPYTLKAGDVLPVKVLFENKPLAGQKVTAFHRAGDTVTSVSATTDKTGAAEFKLTKGGVWLVRGVHMRRVTEKNPAPAADWESFWASVTFELPAK
jgi:uncharacterized GH25 family protein